MAYHASMPRASLALLLTVLGVGIVGCSSGSEPTHGSKATADSFSGTVVDVKGKPAANASVWLLEGSVSAGTRIIAQAATDEKGRFCLAQAPSGASTSHRPGALAIFVRDREGRIGGEINLDQPAGNSAADLWIELLDVKDYRGRLLDAAGRPIAGATIRPLYWTREWDWNWREPSIIFPDELQKELAVKTTANGDVVLRNVPAEGVLSTTIEAGKLVVPQEFWKLESPASVRLVPPGAVQVAVTCPKSPAAAEGIALHLYRIVEGPNITSGASRALCLPDGLTGEDGSFRFQGVPAGRYWLMPEPPDATPYYPERVAAFQVKSGATATISVSLKPAVKVQSVVVDKTTQKGIAGATVFNNYYLVAIENEPIRRTTTDAHGTFAFYVKPGRTTISMDQAPDPDVCTSYQRMIFDGEMTKDTQLPPCLLERAVAVEGLAVDKADQPVSGAEIYLFDGSGIFTSRNILHSDAHGKFRLTNILPNSRLALYARTKKSVAALIEDFASPPGTPLRLVFDSKQAARLGGAVVDDAGKPVRGASVNVVFATLLRRLCWSDMRCFPTETTTTDDDGKFVIDGLWPERWNGSPGDDAAYYLRVTAEGYDRSGVSLVVAEAKPGGVTMLPTLVLLPAVGVVEGAVSDTAGKPVADVRVFNAGDGPEPTETYTDQAGHFRLEGLTKGRPHVFAEKEGYRFTGIRARSGATDVRLTVLRSEESPVARPAPPTVVSYEEQKKLGQELLTKLWSKADDDQKSRILAVMARIDLEQAARWAEEDHAKLDPIIGRAAMDKIAEADLDEALSLIVKETNRYLGDSWLTQLAGCFAKSDPQKALRCAEEKLMRARSLDQPQRTEALADSGALIFQLGNKEAGRKLVREAAEEAVKWPVSGRSRSRIYQVARAAAFCDLSSLTKLREKIEPVQYRYLQLDAARSLGDVAQMKALLKDEGVRDNDRPSHMIALAHCIAATRPAEALSLLEEAIDRYDSDGSRVWALSGVAGCIAPRDPKQANALIEWAISYAAENACRDPDRAIFTAVLAAQAVQFGSPDPQADICRALAARPAFGDTRCSWRQLATACQSQKALLAMAMFLAICDPPTAQDILQTFEEGRQRAGSDAMSLPPITWRGTWLRAWALADPRHARALVQRHSDSIKDKNEKELWLQDVLQMALLWSVPPDERLRYLASRYTRGMIGAEPDGPSQTFSSQARRMVEKSDQSPVGPRWFP